MRERRADKLEQERAALEVAYRDALVIALRECADGHWGLFGQNDAVLADRLRERFTPESAKRLNAIGEELSALRSRLGSQEPSDLERRFSAYRALRGQNRIGEARLAQQFLEELNATA